MKLIFKEYLASLKERDDLDVILPDLLSEIGWSVFSKPAVGTRQHGVDVAAVGADDVGGKKKVFLFSIKAGDLRRSSWDSGEQSLRQSLNEIRDVYINTLQLWYPGDDSEEHFYRGSADHGLAATGIKVVRSCGAMVASIAAECTASSAFRSLSAIRRGLWPLVILACRHHRMPVPPHFWGLNDAGSA